MQLQRRDVQIPAVDLHEYGPSPVAGLGRFPSLDDANLVWVVDQDAHGRTDGRELVRERRKVGDLVGGHGEAVEDLMSSCGGEQVGPGERMRCLHP